MTDNRDNPGGYPNSGDLDALLALFAQAGGGTVESWRDAVRAVALAAYERGRSDADVMQSKEWEVFSAELGKLRKVQDDPNYDL